MLGVFPLRDRWFVQRKAGPERRAFVFQVVVMYPTRGRIRELEAETSINTLSQHTCQSCIFIGCFTKLVMLVMLKTSNSNFRVNARFLIPKLKLHIYGSFTYIWSFQEQRQWASLISSKKTKKKHWVPICYNVHNKKKKQTFYRLL